MLWYLMGHFEVTQIKFWPVDGQKKQKWGKHASFISWIIYLVYFIGLNCSNKNSFGLAFVIITTTLTLV